MAKRRILVADDERESADLLQQIIESEHPDDIVEVAYDGAQALDMARRTRPDIVVLDLEMPGLDGEIAAQRMRERWGAEAPLLIALSGNTDRIAGLKRAAGPFDHAFTKPLDVDRLLALFPPPA